MPPPGSGSGCGGHAVDRSAPPATPSRGLNRHGASATRLINSVLETGARHRVPPIGSPADMKGWLSSTDNASTLVGGRGILPPKPTLGVEGPELPRFSLLVATNMPADNNLVAINRRNSEP